MAMTDDVDQDTPPLGEQSNAGQPVGLPVAVSLNVVRLIRSECHMSLSGNGLPDLASFNVGAKARRHKTEGTVLCDVTISLEGKSSTPESESKLAINAVYQCVFNPIGSPDLADVPEDDWQALQGYSILQAWPYLRAHVTSITASMCLQPLSLPLFVEREGKLQLLR